MVQSLGDIVGFFRNAIKQAIILNPRMNSHGISLLHFIEDQRIMSSEDRVNVPMDLQDPKLAFFDPQTLTEEKEEDKVDGFFSNLTDEANTDDNHSGDKAGPGNAES